MHQVQSLPPRVRHLVSATQFISTLLFVCYFLCAPDWMRKLKSGMQTREYCGDLFSSRSSASGYNEGIIYLSRMTRPTTALAEATAASMKDAKRSLSEEDEELVDEVG